MSNIITCIVCYYYNKFIYILAHVIQQHSIAMMYIGEVYMYISA